MEPSLSWNDYQDKLSLQEELLAKVDSCIDLVNL